jgi:protein phosphatase 2C-like protein
MPGSPSRAWRNLAASVIGSSHTTQNLPCQDAHSIANLDDGTLIVAVADGAGSAKRSEEGARCAVATSVEYLRKCLESTRAATSEEYEAILSAAIEHARVALQEIAPGVQFNDVATTLLLTIVSDRWLSTIQVGDGAVVCRHVSGTLQVLSELGRSEFINETTFLTSSDYLNHIHRVTLPSEEVSGLAMFSDGIQLLAIRYADNTAHVPFFEPLFRFASDPTSTDSELEEFLRSERVCERTDDDKTLILSVRNESH